jgi:hypothetical protein
MRKQPETVDYFRLVINRLSQEQLGVVIADLARREIFDIKPELITDVVTYNKKQAHAVKAEDLLIDWMAEHPNFRAIEAVTHFRAAGRTDGSCYTAMRVLRERKLIRKVGEGQYSTVAAKSQPKKAKAAAKHRDVDNHTFILRAASRNHGRFNTAWMKKQFEADGRGSGSVSPTISALMKKKQIKRVSDSEYVLPQKAAKPKKGNGADHAVTEAAHG